MGDSESTTRKATRSSVACVPCRSRHLKCNGSRPRCARCAEAGEECHYTQSRRGGLDRAALAERRKRLAAAEGLSLVGGGGTGGKEGAGKEGGGSLYGTRAWQKDADGGRDEDLFSNGLLSGTLRFRSEAGPSPPVQFEGIEGDGLIGTFYKTFHRFHPFVLPHRHLSLFYSQSTAAQVRLQPLIAVIRLIGHLYSTKELSHPLQDAVEASLSVAEETDPFTTQSRLLFSIVLFWHRFNREARREMDAAVSMARDVGMFLREYALEHGGGSPVLAESWRRTWWMLFIVDAYYAGTLGTLNLAIVDVDATAELPCEEAEYESGVRFAPPRPPPCFSSRSSPY